MRAPGSTRELELVRVRKRESIRGRVSAPPDCFRMRGMGAERREPLAWPFTEVERERSGSFKADRNGFFVVVPEVARLRLTPGCGVCVREGRWVDCWDVAG